MAAITPTLAVHPAAAIFPMISDEEMTELAKSINDHGLREKITIITDPEVSGQWLIVDGRNRAEALRRMNVKDKDIIEKFSVAKDFKRASYTVEEYVIMANIERRNLTGPQRKKLAGQLAIMLAEAQKDKPKEEQVDTTQKAATAAGVSRRTAATAKKEQLQSPAPSPGVSREKPKPKAKSGISPIKLVEGVLKCKNALLATGHNWPEAQLTAVLDMAKVIEAQANLNIARIQTEKLAEAEKIIAEAKAAETAVSA